MDGGDKIVWIIANWKSNKTISEALEWISKVGPNLPKQDNLKIVVSPTFSCLSEVKKTIQVNNFPCMLGSQDLSAFGVGAYTGEESALLLKDLVSLAILGHSERRKNFAETDEIVEQKSNQAKENNIIPLVCVQGADAVIPPTSQLIAYEPIFAIGTGNPDTPENANLVAKQLKEKKANLEVIYGGSVNSQNVKDFVSQSEISGVLIGGASLDPQEFIKICQAVAERE